MEENKPSKEIMKYLPHFSLAERDRRWEQIRYKMVLRGLDCLLLWGNDIFWDMGMVNFRYLTHVGSKHGGLALFPLEGDPVVFSAPPHINTPFSPFLSSQDWVDDIRSYTGLAPVVEAMKEMGFEGGRIGVVGYGSALAMHSVTHKDYVRLLEMMPKADFTEATPLVEEMRLIKSPEEIGMLEKAGQIGRKTIDAMIETARPGIKECELYAEMVRTQIANGGEAQIFLLLTSGPIDGNESGVKHLLHGVEQPYTPTTRELQKGDIVICEFHSCYGGYMTATEFTVSVGTAPPEYHRIHDVSVECMHAEAEAMRPGATLREVWEAARAPVKKAGIEFLELGFHGHGMASPEFPVVVYKTGEGLMAGAGIGDFKLREGMVLGQNIDLYDPNWKTDVGHMLGDCLVIEAQGGRRLVGTPEELPEVGA